MEELIDKSFEEILAQTKTYARAIEYFFIGREYKAVVKYHGFVLRVYGPGLGVACSACFDDGSYEKLARKCAETIAWKLFIVDDNNEDQEGFEYTVKVLSDIIYHHDLYC